MAAGVEGLNDAVEGVSFSVDGSLPESDSSDAIFRRPERDSGTTFTVIGSPLRVRREGVLRPVCVLDVWEDDAVLLRVLFAGLLAGTFGWFLE